METSSHQPSHPKSPDEDARLDPTLTFEHLITALRESAYTRIIINDERLNTYDDELSKMVASYSDWLKKYDSEITILKHKRKLYRHNPHIKGACTKRIRNLKQKMLDTRVSTDFREIYEKLVQRINELKTR